MDLNVSVSSALDASKPAAAVATKAAAGTDGKVSVNDGSAATPKPSRDEVGKAVKDMQAFVDANQRNLNFSIDESTGDVVVKVIATTSGEVIRQMPSEEALKLAQSMKDPKNVVFHAQV